MARAHAEMDRVQWSELTDGEYRGCWIALDDARYDLGSRQPVDGRFVDADEDLAALCARLQSSERGGCSVHYCDDGGSGIRRSPA